ncbi:MAG: hypothetical protein ACLQIB_58155 [Isosphaeraceae bacterium]
MSILVAGLLVHCASVMLDPPLELLGTLDRRRIPEASGIVKSRRYPEIFWVHNDSGNPPLLFAIRRDGRIVRQFRLEVPNIDWEDIAIDDQGHLYVGDIGNNGGVLPVRVIYRVDEPDPAKAADRPLRASSATFYTFPTKGRFDAEGLVFDRGNAIVVAKYLDRRQAGLFTVSLETPAPLLRPAHPRSIGLLPDFTEPATGAALSDKLDLLAVCSSDVTRVYDREKSGGWRLLSEVRYQSQQIEGIAWDGPHLILVAEGGGLYRLAETTWRRVRRDAGTGPAKSPRSKPSALDRGKSRNQP